MFCNASQPSPHRSQGRRTTTQCLKPCPWRLTYLINGKQTVETIDAQHLDTAALLIGKGFPIAAQFDHHKNDDWLPVSPHALLGLRSNPVLERQQHKLDLEADHEFTQF